MLTGTALNNYCHQFSVWLKTLRELRLISLHNAWVLTLKSTNSSQLMTKKKMIRWYQAQFLKLRRLKVLKPEPLQSWLSSARTVLLNSISQEWSVEKTHSFQAWFVEAVRKNFLFPIWLTEWSMQWNNFLQSIIVVSLIVPIGILTFYLGVYTC